MISCLLSPALFPDPEIAESHCPVTSVDETTYISPTGRTDRKDRGLKQRNLKAQIFSKPRTQAQRFDSSVSTGIVHIDRASIASDRFQSISALNKRSCGPFSKFSFMQQIQQSQLIVLSFPSSRSDRKLSDGDV